MNKQMDMPDLSGLMGMLTNMAAKTGTTMSDKPVWWRTFSYPDHHNFEIQNLIALTKTALFFQVLDRPSDQIHEIAQSGLYTGDRENVLQDTIKNTEYKLIYTASKLSFESNTIEYFLVKEHGALYLKTFNQWNSKGNFYLNCVTTNKPDLDKIRIVLNKYTTKL